MKLNRSRQRATIKNTLKLNLPVRSKIYRHEIVTVDKCSSALECNLSADNITSRRSNRCTGDVCSQLDVVVVRSINPTEGQFNGVTDC